MSTSSFYLSTIIAGFLAWLPTENPNAAWTQTKSVEIRYCHFPVSEFIKRANMDFNVVYSFRVDEDGKPRGLSKIRDNYLDVQTVAPCLDEWRLSSLSPDETYHLVSNWEHGVGWTRMSVVGKERKLTITPFGEPHPYARHANPALENCPGM